MRVAMLFWHLPQAEHTAEHVWRRRQWHTLGVVKRSVVKRTAAPQQEAAKVTSWDKRSVYHDMRHDEVCAQVAYRADRWNRQQRQTQQSSHGVAGDRQ